MHVTTVIHIATFKPNPMLNGQRWTDLVLFWQKAETKWRQYIYQGRIQDLKLGGALKFFLGVFRVKNHDFTQKNLIFSNFSGAGGWCAPPESAPVYYIHKMVFNTPTNFKLMLFY